MKRLLALREVLAGAEAVRTTWAVRLGDLREPHESPGSLWTGQSNHWTLHSQSHLVETLVVPHRLHFSEVGFAERHKVQATASWK